MLTKLRLRNFKNFKDVEFEFGGLTLLLGTNAVGKSNVCEALRFLSAMGRGYTLAQAIGGHYENGTLQWRGIRGWMSEIAFYGESTFSIEATFTLGPTLRTAVDNQPATSTYYIEVEIGTLFNSFNTPKILSEILTLGIKEQESVVSITFDPSQLKIQFNDHELDLERFESSFDRSKSIISQPIDRFIAQVFDHDTPQFTDMWILLTTIMMNSIRDFDWDPRVMRDSVLPGYKSIGDRGEGLVSVLHSIFQQDHLKEACMDWLNALTPMDVTDLEFVSEESGKIALRMIESGGRKISAASASDGTLIFLATLAAYFSPMTQTQQLYFLEELENGIHPTRLHLLLQLIEQRAEARKIQTIATTHSPQLLRFLSEDSLNHAYVIYRSDDRSDAQVRRIIDIPNIREVLETTDLGELLESGWMETTLSFERDEESVG